MPPDNFRRLYFKRLCSPHKLSRLANIIVMAIIFVRSLIIYITLILVMRLMGKRQIGEMQPYEFVVTLLIAELACIPMADVSIPLLYGVAAMLAVFVLHQFLSLIEQSGATAKKIVSGSPSVVINKNGVDFKELKKNNMDVDDLIESMRAAGYCSLEQLKYAIYESNGKLSTVESDAAEKIKDLPVIIVKNGKIDKKNRELSGITDDEFNMILKTASAKSVKEIGVLTVDGSGRFYVQKPKEKYKTGKLEFKGVKW